MNLNLLFGYVFGSYFLSCFCYSFNGDIFFSLRRRWRRRLRRRCCGFWFRSMFCHQIFLHLWAHNTLCNFFGCFFFYSSYLFYSGSCWRSLRSYISIIRNTLGIINWRLLRGRGRYAINTILCRSSCWARVYTLCDWFCFIFIH